MTRRFLPLAPFVALSLVSSLFITGCSEEPNTPKPSEQSSEQQENTPLTPEEFLAKNAKRKGVITTESGLQYRVIKDGKGDSPTNEDFAIVNYIGRHLSGEEFDNSFKRDAPATVPVAGVISGWSEALKLMQEGAKWELWIPADLAYGEEGAGGVIAPNEPLVFDIELLEVRTEKEMADLRLEKFKERQLYKEENEKFLAENIKKSSVKSTDSGLQYEVLREGGGKQPAASDTVEVHYSGTLIDGTEFDSSYSRNQTATFPVNGVIKGWVEALQMMREGGKWRLYIPEDLAYGSRGAGPVIKPYSTLIFEVELISIK